jgi:DNA-binding NarL/FixJ family response regulator
VKRGKKPSAPKKKYKFLVVDDHPVFRKGLVALIETNWQYQMCGQVGTIDEALEVIETKSPDIVLVDISLGDNNGLELVKTLKKSYPDLPVLVISMHDELIYTERAMKAGARGYVMKQEALEVIQEAIKTVLADKIFVSPVMRQRLLELVYTHKDAERSDLIGRLSERELEVLEYIGQGYGASEISKILNLSVKTVNTYRDHIKLKLNLEDAAETRRFAVKWYNSQRS